MKSTGRAPFIVAISSVSGGGKTTITTLLNEALPHSRALYFDDYDFNGPEDIRENGELSVPRQTGLS